MRLEPTNRSIADCVPANPLRPTVALKSAATQGVSNGVRTVEVGIPVDCLGGPSTSTIQAVVRAGRSHGVVSALAAASTVSHVSVTVGISVTPSWGQHHRHDQSDTSRRCRVVQGSDAS